MGDEKNKQNKNIPGKMFFLSPEINLFFRNVFYLPKLIGFYSEIDNNLMRALVMRGLNLMRALIYIKQRKKHSGLTEGATMGLISLNELFLYLHRAM